MENNKQQIVIICGPTASGKTSLALQLAKELKKVNILSVDSRQVYNDLDIITGKDIPNNLPKNIAIYGHNIFNPDERANLADFQRYSQAIIESSNTTHTPLIIVGGTGLYLKSLTQKLADVSVPPNPKLREKLEKLSLIELQETLRKTNPEKLNSLNHSDFMNPRRLIRYIEISQSKTKSKHDISLQKEITFHWIGLLPEKETLKENIRNRVIARINSGAVGEVTSLQKWFPDNRLAIYTSLGVSQIIDFLAGKLTKKELIDAWTNAEVDYARRQIVWFKKQPSIVWYDKSTDRNLLINQLKNIYLKNA